MVGGFTILTYPLKLMFIEFIRWHLQVMQVILVIYLMVSDMGGSFSSPTRGYLVVDHASTITPATLRNTIEFITIQHKGNAKDFGEFNYSEVMEGSWCSSYYKWIFWWWIW